MKPPRVGIIGARRNRQGLGPYVARFLRDAGAEVACFLATGRATLEQARHELRELHAIEATGYLDLEQMLREESLDALAILSPAETHRRYLNAALEAGLHVLCEKPFIWEVDGLAGETRRLVSGFRERGLRLWENCSWPYTIPSYQRLYPATRDSVPSRFEMQLSPVSTGLQMLGDAMPHAWSLLQAFSPGHDATVEELRFSTREIDSPELTVEFRYITESALVESTVRLAQSKSQPREAGFGIDGFWAKRLIRMEDYSILFGDGPRIVDVPDPLGLLVTDFVRDLASPSDATAGSRADQIVQRMQLLDYVVTEYERGND